MKADLQTSGRFDLDHVVILVDDLVRATEDYSNLGFNVIEGGEHAGGLTHNALIPFQDGSYLELIAFKSRVQSPGSSATQHVPDLWRRFENRRALGEGLVDFALSSASLVDDILRLKQEGLDFSDPSPGGRSRPDGQELHWMTALPPTFDLPFLIEDWTLRSLRVPGGQAATHANGALGIVKVTVITNNLRSSALRYAALFGAATELQPAPIRQLAPSVEYQTTNALISLIPPPPGNEGTTGDRPYSIELLMPGPTKPLRTDGATHGARIEVRTKA